LVAVVEKNNTIYVIGGFNGNHLNNVENYNPATDTWTEEAPLLTGVSSPAAGLIGTWIVVADGYAPYGEYGGTEGYNPSTNAWTAGAEDPTPRDGVCGGFIGTQLYVAGGYPGYGSAVLTLTESFDVKSNTWTTLADIPQSTVAAGSAVYNGQLYCFGGAGLFVARALNNVQIYTP